MAIDTGALYYLVDPFVQWENVNGKPIVGGHVEVFEAGTDNKIITYADWDGTRHPFKIPLGSDGRAVILVDPGYRYDAYVYDSFNNLVCSRLNIIPLSDGDITIDGMGQVYHDDTLSGKGTPNSPLTVISGGKVYGGIYPIDVNNELDMISADNVPLGVQAPLYFAQDDDEGLVIALSSVPVPEGTMNESAFGYEDGQITSYNGTAFSAGLNYEAGSYVDIDGNTINVTGLQPAGNYQSAGDYVVHDELSSYATQDWVENQSYMKEYMESAFYPSTSNPSGYLTEHQDISNKLDTTAFSTVSGDFLTAVPSEYITENTLQSGLSSKLDSTAFSTVSGDFLTAVPEGYATEDWVTAQGYLTAHQSLEGYATEDWVTGQGYLTAHQSLDGLMSADLLEISDNKITGYNGTAFAGQGGVTGDFELSAGSGISIVDYPLEQKTVISVTAQGGNPEVEQAVIDNSATWNDVTAKQDSLTFGYHDTAISSIDEAALYDNSAHARINTLAGRISDLSSNKLDTTAFSDVSGTFLTAHQDLSNYATTAQLADKVDSSAIGIKTGPVDTVTAISGTYISAWTANNASYATKSWSATRAKNDENDIPITSYLRTIPDTYLQNTDLATADGKVTAISGIPLSAGGDVPEGVMVESGLEYNAVNEISAYNGSAIAQYGAEKQWLVHDDTLVHAANSAQYALGVNLSAVAQLLGVDETVLWDNANGSQNITLNEAAQNFEFIKVEWCPYTEASNWTAPYDIVTNKLSNDNLHLVGWGISNDHSYQICTNLILSFSSTTVSVNTLGTITISPNAANTSNLNGWKIYKVIGIGRKGV